MRAAFDTLDATRRLEDAGIERKHAEAIATVVRDGQDRLATSDQVDALGGRLDTKVDALGDQLGALGNQITTLGNEMRSSMTTLRWIVGVNFAMTIAALASILTHSH